MRLFRVIDPVSRLVAALFLVFALCWQAGIVRAHIHEVPGFAAASAVHRANHPSRSGDEGQDCPVCAEEAAAGVYLAAAPPVLAAPIEAPIWRAAIVADPAPRLLRSHDWRSRAPPILRTT
ncbi:hypothetical protein [Sphingomonas pokkalii]|uniref:DUF2946 domain-containing protein n=1 Tax=Sphingomonas pokkalii TaxID=2175090 RepID=A0A2U0SDP7_9SPHN|nr:hypothetical protein [Sphingomonas pokkalii]PVX29506.1 hypothetical protein DD559_09410 [Sphingomonas pokkalii]